MVPSTPFTTPSAASRAMGGPFVAAGHCSHGADEDGRVLMFDGRSDTNLAGPATSCGARHPDLHARPEQLLEFLSAGNRSWPTVGSCRGGMSPEFAGLRDTTSSIRGGDMDARGHMNYVRWYPTTVTLAMVEYWWCRGPSTARLHVESEIYDPRPTGGRRCPALRFTALPLLFVLPDGRGSMPARNEDPDDHASPRRSRRQTWTVVDPRSSRWAAR